MITLKHPPITANDQAFIFAWKFGEENHTRSIFGKKKRVKLEIIHPPKAVLKGWQEQYTNPSSVFRVEDKVSDKRPGPS